jgi:hypothetical protein
VEAPSSPRVFGTEIELVSLFAEKIVFL